MLRVDLRAVEDAPVDVSGVLEPDDAALEGLDAGFLEPVRARGRLTCAGTGRYYWRGSIDAVISTQCRRCLASVSSRIEVSVDVLYTDDVDADDPAVYVIPEGAQSLDLRETIREELVLTVPEYSLCRDDCRGLCPRCGRDLNAGSCQCVPETDPRWAALESLRSTLPGREEP